MIIEENEFNIMNEEVKKDILKDNYILYGEDSNISLKNGGKNMDNNISGIMKKYKSERLYTTGEIAKELGISSAARLNNILEHKKIQFKRNGTWMLYSKYVDKGFVVMRHCELECGIKVYDRKWTEKGRIFIHSIFD